MNSALATRINEAYAQAAGALPSALVGRERRRRALDSFTALGLPIHRDENWRYADLHALQHVRFAPPPQAAPTAILHSDLPPGISGYSRYTFVDGRFAPELSHSPQDAVRIFSLERSPAAFSTAGVAQPADLRLALLNEAFALDGASVKASDTARPACIELVFVARAGAEAGTSYPRVEVQAEPRARLSLIERHISFGTEASCINGVVSLRVEPGATVDHYRLQQTGRKATWMDSLSARVADGATYKLCHSHLGAQSARSTLQISLAGHRAAVVLNAIGVPDRQQTHDTFAVVEHAAEDTQTEQRFRGIAAEQAHVSFVGKVVVREGAHRALSRQSLRGLLTGAQAEVNVRPQLEIYTDDVQCSHGSTVGKLDEAMLFYLLSRGLERESAQLLLKWAFLEDVVAQIELAELRRQIEQTLVAQIDGGSNLKEML